MELEITRPVKVQAKTLKVYLKVCDQFYATLYDQHGACLKEYEGYVPGFMPGKHYGVYVDLHIDIDSGQITNWEVPSASDMQEFITGGGY